MTTAPLPTNVPASTTPTPGCASTTGMLEQQELTSTSLAGKLRFTVYLPPCYKEETGRSYPVLYLFHGQFYDENQWVRLGVQETADGLIASGEIAPFMVIMPFDPYAYQPSEYGFDEAFLRELLPYVDSQYRTLTDRDHRALGGLSRGSSWSLHFALSHPELFGKFGMHSPVVFATDGLLVEKWLDIIPPERMPQIYLDVSENDQNIQNVYWLENILTTRGIPHEWHLNTGFHEEEYWAAHVEEYMLWYASGWDMDP